MLGSRLGRVLAARCDDEKNATKCALILPNDIVKSSIIMSNFSASLYTALYSDNRYRTGDNVKVSAVNLQHVSIISEGEVNEIDIDWEKKHVHNKLPTSNNIDVINNAINTGKGFANGIILAKDIVNAPHNVLNSKSLANVAREIAKER